MATERACEAEVGGYQWSFVDEESLDRDFKCPICCLVMREPHLTDCCGAHFCKSCIAGVRRERGAGRLRSTGSCPMCRKATFQIMVDQNLNRKTLLLSVYCDHKSLGCSWRGELKHLLTHHKQCPYQMVVCPLKCNAEIFRKDVAEHTHRECINRPFSCPHCSLLATYSVISSTHYPVCKQYPLMCPNACSQDTILRCDLDQHLEICPLQPMPCPLHSVGCNVVLVQSELNHHMQESIHTHLDLLCTSHCRLLREVSEMKSSCTTNFDALKQEFQQFKSTLMSSMRSMQSDTKALQRQVKAIQTENTRLKSETQRQNVQPSPPLQTFLPVQLPQASRPLPASSNLLANLMPMRELFSSQMQAQTEPVEILSRQMNTVAISTQSQGTFTGDRIALPNSISLVFGNLVDLEADTVVVPVNTALPRSSGEPAVSFDARCGGALFSYLFSQGKTMWEGSVYQWPVTEALGLKCKNVILLPRSKITALGTILKTCTNALRTAKSLNSKSIVVPVLTPHSRPADVARTILSSCRAFRDANPGCSDLSISVAVKNRASNVAFVQALTNQYATV